VLFAQIVAQYYGAGSVAVVAEELHAHTSSTGSQLAISDVVAYRLISIGEVVVTYKALNITSHVVGNGNPAFLAVFDPSVAASSRKTTATRPCRATSSRESQP
jgi:hypothetical protein